MRLAIRPLLIAVIVLCTALPLSVVAAAPPVQVLPEAEAALMSGQNVIVETDPWLTFRPATGEPTVGVVIYPGGLVAPEAYAPTARQLAAAGYLAVIVPVPLQLAVFGADRAAAVIAANPEIEAWAVAGHSLGGSAAAYFANTYPDLVDGLVLWASFTDRNNDLSDDDALVVSSIYATLDGLATVAEVEAANQFLPESTTYVVIEGGNHAYFGWYGDQDGDLPATISRAEQQALIVDATVAVLEQIGAGR
ncbi:MAG: alpha/beta hydrolase [Chloroflexi bacterium]|nr:alpha/beta hydrolase [Chloroflexota bacterium]